jgi:hypothetical protein
MSNFGENDEKRVSRPHFLKRPQKSISQIKHWSFDYEHSYCIFRFIGGLRTLFKSNIMKFHLKLTDYSEK